MVDINSNNKEYKIIPAAAMPRLELRHHRKLSPGTHVQDTQTADSDRCAIVEAANTRASFLPKQLEQELVAFNVRH